MAAAAASQVSIAERTVRELHVAPLHQHRQPHELISRVPPWPGCLPWALLLTARKGDAATSAR